MVSIMKFHVLIRTKRLIIRDLQISDALDVFLYRSDHNVRKYQNFNPQSVDDVFCFIRENTSLFDFPGKWYQVGIVYADKVIGDIGIHFVDPENKECQIGYTISPEYQRRGFGQEAVVALINYLFGELGKHRVTACVYPDNTASISLLEKIGFQKENHVMKSNYRNRLDADDLFYEISHGRWKEKYAG